MKSPESQRPFIKWLMLLIAPEGIEINYVSCTSVKKKTLNRTRRNWNGVNLISNTLNATLNRTRRNWNARNGMWTNLVNIPLNRTRRNWNLIVVADEETKKLLLLIAPEGIEIHEPDSDLDWKRKPLNRTRRNWNTALTVDANKLASLLIAPEGIEMQLGGYNSSLGKTLNRTRRNWNCNCA